MSRCINSGLGSLTQTDILKCVQIFQCTSFFFFFFFFYGQRTKARVGTLSFYFILFYLFMAVLGPRFCARAFSSCGKRGPLFITVRGPLTIAASLVAEHRLQTRRLSSCGSRAQLLRDMWDPPRLGLEPVSPALVGRTSTTAPSGKPSVNLLLSSFVFIFGVVSATYKVGQCVFNYPNIKRNLRKHLYFKF